MTTTMTMLDKPLGDLSREITDLRKNQVARDYDMNKLFSIITISKDSLKETEKFQEKILNQLQQFEISLADINQILRANAEQRMQLEQQQQQSSMFLSYILFSSTIVLIERRRYGDSSKNNGTEC